MIWLGFLVNGPNSGYKYQQAIIKNGLSNGDGGMANKRKNHRRRFIPVTRSPLHTPSGDLITSERRMLPTRRLNDIAAEEITIDEFISGFSSHCT